MELHVYHKSLIQININGIFQIKTLETESTAIKHNWRCAVCGKQDNLWFNLSDGYIGCGRTQWDGSGGCSAARRC